MDSFVINRDQVTAVIAQLVAEKLSRKENHHIDFMTVATWDSETVLGAISEFEFSECAAKICGFFGVLEQMPADLHSQSIGKWADFILEAISRSFANMTFYPAGQNENGCVHTSDQIFADAAGVANLMHGRRRLLSLVAPHSLMGFVLSVLVPNLLHIPSIAIRQVKPAELQDLLEFGDVVIATPSLWRFILRENITAPDNAMSVSFGEPLTVELSAELRKSGFGVQREIYGSTETGLIGWRDSPTDPFLLFDQWENSDGVLVRMPCDGLARGSVRIEPMDLLEWVDDRKFLLSGRRDGAIQIGAINVFPDQIANVLKKHGLVKDCLVRVVRQKGGINRLTAHIILMETASPSENTVRTIDRYCRIELRPQERPSIYHFERELPA